MKNIWIRLTLISLVIISTSLLLIACTSKPSILGYWQDTKQKNLYLEFIDDGSLILDNGEAIISGTYELISENYVKINNIALPYIINAEIFGDTLKYEVSGNSLNLQAANESITLKRIR